MADRLLYAAKAGPGWGMPVVQYAGCVVVTLGLGFALGWTVGGDAEPSVVWPTRMLEAVPLPRAALKPLPADAAGVPHQPVPNGVPDKTLALRAGAISIDGVLGVPKGPAPAWEPKPTAAGIENSRK